MLGNTFGTKTENVTKNTLNGTTENFVVVTRRRTLFEYHIHGSVHRESNLITVQQDATYSVYYISVDSSKCFGC